jgi:hypothetical protein
VKDVLGATGGKQRKPRAKAGTSKAAANPKGMKAKPVRSKGDGAVAIAPMRGRTRV